MILTIWARHLPFILMKQRLCDDQAAILFYNGLRRRTLKHAISSEITQQNTGSVRQHPGSKVIMIVLAAVNTVQMLGTQYLTWDARQHSYI